MGNENWERPGAGTPEADRKEADLTPGEKLIRTIENPERFKAKTGKELEEQHRKEGFYPSGK